MPVVCNLSPDRSPERWVQRFWSEPLSPSAQGNTDARCTDQQLDAWEKKIGFPLPKLLREQYKVQNGGYPLLTYYVDTSGKTFVDRQPRQDPSDAVEGVFAHGGDLMPIGGKPYTFRKWLRTFWSDEDIKEYCPSWKLERLVILSFLEGHSLLFVDYGYKNDDVFDPPQVLLMNGDELTENIRVDSREHFVESLLTKEEVESAADDAAFAEGELYKRDFDLFRVELPAGSSLTMEPLKTRWGLHNVTFKLGGEEMCLIMVSIVSSMGKSVPELVADAQRKAARKGYKELVVTEQSDTRYVFAGTPVTGRPTTLISTLDPDAEQLGILLIMGEGKRCKRAAQGVTPTNPKLKFF